MPDKDTLADGDSGFYGINMRQDPGTLEMGVAADARNIVFRNGVAETRLGVIKPAWLNNIQPEITGAEINPWSAIYGVTTYRDPNSREYILLAAEGDVYYCRENNDPVKLGLPAGVKVLDNVTFVQAFNKSIMFRGVNLAPLVLSDIDDGFEDQLAHWDSTISYVVDTSEVAYGPWQNIKTYDAADLPSGITHSGGVATATTAGDHNYVTGADITIRGAAESEFNGRFNITVTSTSTFTYAGGTGSVATGTITCSNQANYWLADSDYTALDEPGVDGWTQSALIMPNAETAAFIQNRVVVATSWNSTTKDYTTSKKDFLFCSDILDPLHMFFTAQFRINEGSDDELVELLKLNDNNLVIFKDKSVHMLSSFITTSISTGTGGLDQSIVLETLIPNYGTPGPRAAVLVGQDVYFYAGRRGIISMSQTEQGKVQGVDLPLSEPVQAVIDRIDPRYENLIRLAYADNRLFCALPLDDGSVSGNNCCLIYDFLNKSWSGRYDGEAISIKEFFKAFYSGSERLFFLANDGFVNLMDESSHGDDIRDTDRDNNIGLDEIETKLTTRGYHHADLNQRFFKSVQFSVGTWNPKFSANLVMDGAYESQSLVTDRTKSRTDYYRPFDRAPYTVTNENADHGEPYREDYSVGVAESCYILTQAGDTLTLEDGAALHNNDCLGVYPGSDFKPFRFQETLESFRVASREGRYGQLELTNNQGRIRVKQAIMTTQTGASNIQVKS